MFGADNRLSLAASAIWKARQSQGNDYDMDGSGELGDRIAAHHHSIELRILAEHGFTPRSFNDELKKRMLNPDGTMTYGVHIFLRELEVDTREQAEGHRVVFDGMERSSLAYLYGDSHPCGQCGQPINSSQRKICLDCEAQVPVCG